MSSGYATLLSLTTIFRDFRRSGKNRAGSVYRLPHGKKLVFIQVQGRPDEGSLVDVFDRYDGFFRWYGFEERHLIRGWGGASRAGEVLGREEVMGRVEEVAMHSQLKLLTDCGTAGQQT